MRIEKTKERYYTELDKMECQRRLRKALGKTVLQSDFRKEIWENRVIRERKENLFRISYCRIERKKNSGYFTIGTACSVCEIKEFKNGTAIEVRWKKRISIVIYLLLVNTFGFFYFKVNSDAIIWFDYVIRTIVLICLLCFNYNHINFLFAPLRCEPVENLKEYLCELLELEKMESR